MADPAPTNIPTISASDMASIAQNMGDDPRSFGTGQGQGQSYLSFIPGYVQGTFGGSGAGEIQDVTSGNDPVFNWLQQNGYLSLGMSGGGDSGGTTDVVPGWRAQGLTGQTVQPGQATMPALQASGAYNPTQDVGPQGFGTGNNLLIAPNNPFANTIGSIDQKEMQTPQQAPQDYGKNSFYGADTVSKNNLQSNQDFWSQYFVPGLEAAAGMAFGAVPGLADPAFAAGGFGEPGTMLSSIPGLGSSTDPTNGINTKALLAGAAGAAIGGGLNAVGAPSWTRQFINPALSMAQGGKPSLNPAQLALSLANAGSRYLE